MAKGLKDSRHWLTLPRRATPVRVRRAQKSNRVQILQVLTTSVIVLVVYLYHVRVAYSVLVDIKIRSIHKFLFINHAGTKTLVQTVSESFTIWETLITKGTTVGIEAVMEDERGDTEVCSSPIDILACCKT